MKRLCFLIQEVFIKEEQEVRWGYTIKQATEDTSWCLQLSASLGSEAFQTPLKKMGV